MSELINKTNTNTSEDYFDFLVCSGKPDGNDEVSICDCNNTANTINNSTNKEDEQLTPKKNKRVAGAKDTPTSLYWYEETENFVPISPLASLDELKRKIIKEYIRATSEETRIEDKIDKTITSVTSAITDVTNTIDNIEDVITNITEKVDSHTEEIDKIHSDLENEIHAREKLHCELHHEIHEREKLHCELHQAICHEKCERKHADELLENKIKETEEALMQYINDSTHSIHIENDMDDERKFNVFAGEDKISEFLVPYENLEKVSLQGNTMVFTISLGNGKYKNITVDLPEFIRMYSAGKGIVISDSNVISANINENNKFIKFDENGKIDFNIGLKNNGDLWSYYLTDYNGDIVTDSMFDLNPIKNYIDNGVKSANEYTDNSIDTLKQYTDESISSTTDTLKTYTDSQINALREEIDAKLDSMLIAGDNIKIITNEDGTKTISVKVDKDIHVYRDNLLIDNLPEGGDTLDQAIIKVLNNVVTNADTSDGEEIIL